jgi:hypothetical protein
LLNNVDLPTLGRPTIARMGSLRAGGLLSAADRAISQPHLCQRVKILCPTTIDFDEQFQKNLAA